MSSLSSFIHLPAHLPNQNDMVEFDSFFIGCIFLFLSFTALLFFKNKLDRLLKLKKFARVLGWNTMLTIYGILVVFMIGESYYRFFVDTTDSFAINKISKRWIERYVQTNNSNVRDNIYYHPKIKMGKRRLTIIGDSFSNGHGIKNVENRYSNLIRKKYGNSIEVHNISVSGTNSVAQLQNLNRLSNIGYEFDVILLAFCLNDVDYYVNEAAKIYNRIHAFDAQLGYLEKQSYFINTLSFRFFAMKDPDVMNYSNFVLKGYNGYSWELQKEKLREIKQFVIDQKANLVVFTFPFLQEKKEDYLFRQAHENLGSFWKSEGITHIDLLKTYEPYFGDRLTVNQYDAHPNEFAHQLAANEIERVLQKKNTP